MSEKTLYTLEQLKAMNRSVSWNNKIIIPKSLEEYDYRGKKKNIRFFLRGIIVDLRMENIGKYLQNHLNIMKQQNIDII